MSEWTTPADLRAQVQRLWERGVLAAALVESDEVRFPLRLTLRAPGSADCTQRFDEVRAWSRALQECAGGVRLVKREWRHPVLGRNDLPAEAWIDTVDDALRFIGRQQSARRFTQLVAATRELQPRLVAWLRRRPLQALELEPEWQRLLAVVGWLQACPRPGIYLRQIDLPGVDTKFVERHRGVLAELLDLVLQPGAVDTGAAGLGGFARRYGFRDKPLRIRVRTLDPAVAPLRTGGSEDLAIDVDTLAQLDPPLARVFVTENEVNFLAFPPAAGAWVLFGGGYGLDRLAAIPWLGGMAVHYWGDIDTHGFAILDELRAHLPQAQSFLMDRETFMAHEAQWVEEPLPLRRVLARLTAPERALYDDLRWQRFGERQPRLEQERVAFGRVQAWVRGIHIPPGKGVIADCDDADANSG